MGGTPISPEPLVGELGYEGLAWWRGPLSAVEIAEEAGRPRASWNRRTPANASHVDFGRPIRLVARVRGRADIAQVRFRAFYPSWPRPGAGRDLAGFDPRRDWRQLALCTPPQGRRADPDSPCRWNGDRGDAIVTFDWDPALAPQEPTAPWLPRARPTVTRASDACVPVSLAVEVIDTAGHVSSQVSSLPTPTRCDQRSVARDRAARVIYLDPLVPPRSPAPAWRRRGSWLAARLRPRPARRRRRVAGSLRQRGRLQRLRPSRATCWPTAACARRPGDSITDVPPDTQRYRPRHAEVRRSIPVPQVADVPGALDRWEYASPRSTRPARPPRVRVGGFVGGSRRSATPAWSRRLTYSPHSPFARSARRGAGRQPTSGGARPGEGHRPGATCPAPARQAVPPDGRALGAVCSATLRPHLALVRGRRRGAHRRHSSAGLLMPLAIGGVVGQVVSAGDAGGLTSSSSCFVGLALVLAVATFVQTCVAGRHRRAHRRPAARPRCSDGSSGSSSTSS